MDEPHHTVREIHEQPQAIETVLEALQADRETLPSIVSSPFCLVGCGTSYYLARAGEALLNRDGVAAAIPGGEVLMSPSQLPQSSFETIVPISRSGESTETVAAADQLAAEHDAASVLGVTCTPDSSLDQLADRSIVSPDGSEDSVVMTKSFSSMLVALEYLAELASGSSTTDRFDAVPELSEQTVTAADGLAREIADDAPAQKFVFLGSGPLFGLASEAMLKFEELTLSWSKAYHPLEFRHGPKSIADEETLVTLFVPEDPDERYHSLVEDISALGAETLIIGPRGDLDAFDGTYTFAFPSETVPSRALYMPLVQLLGYYRAVSLGLNPDDPKHLSQVVEL
ncbi:SIS domain-containing protein [Halorhabdus rudnickae]|uniref:SIS domain-containing protein n=1 Tax=Halorhabdus rudnickae TaxID=1775544 RepID=UPI0010833293|nr:SIS domain-containing protein [Halorhabdus rudnickae]